MVDFDKLVLAPASKIFQIKVRFTPLVSNPTAPPFDLHGVYSSSAVDVTLQDDTIFSDQQTSLGVRMRDFQAAVPDRGDTVEIIDTMHPAFGSKYWVGDVDLDGQGGGMIMLRTHRDENP